MKSSAPELLQRILGAAHQAPSLGLMQPWRFLLITDTELRRAIHGIVEQERLRTAEALAELLHMPEGSKPVAILCLGHSDAFYSKPMLELENWSRGRPLTEFVYENTWGEQP